MNQITITGDQAVVDFGGTASVHPGNFNANETICGGAGAGPAFHGAHAVHTHMTHTRLTDPEVLEARFPIRIWKFAIRRGSGGAGRFRGGDGCVRELEFLEPLELSLTTQRRTTRPYGLEGGRDGAPGRNLLRRILRGDRPPNPKRRRGADESRIKTLPPSPTSTSNEATA